LAEYEPYRSLYGDDAPHVPVLLAAFAALAALAFLFYRTRVRWVLPGGRVWDPGYLTAEMPAAWLRAVPRRRRAGLAGGLGAAAVYLLFPAVCTCTALFPPPTARAFYARSEQAYDRDEFDEAIAQATEAIRLNPRYAAAYDLRGLAQGMKGP